MTKTVMNLTDSKWVSTNELGKIEEVIEYSNGEETMKVNVVAHVISGAELDAIESKYSKFNAKTGEIDIDSDGYNKAKLCATFKIDEKTYDKIMKNKSGNLKTKMMMLMNRVSGAKLTIKQIEEQKNLESPEA